MIRILRTRVDLKESEFITNRKGILLVFKSIKQANAYINRNCMQIDGFVKYEAVYC